MARILVVFLRIQRRSRKKRQAKDCDQTGQQVVYRTLAKTSNKWLSRIHSILLQIDRLQLTAVYCNRRECKDNTSKDPFSRCEIWKNLGYRLSWRWQDKVRLQHPEERTLYLELRMRGEMKLTCKTFLLNGETSDTNDNLETKIQRNINTKHMKPNNDVTHLGNTWMYAQLLVFVVLCCHTHSLHTSHGSRCPSVCLISSMHEVSVSSDFLDLFITFIFLLSFLINLKQFLLPFNFPKVK